MAIRHLDPRVEALVRTLNRLPGVTVISSCGGHPPPLRPGEWEEGTFYVLFHIETISPTAWRVVQGLAWVINHDLQAIARLPIIFHPVAAPPSLEDNNEWYLDWAIEGYSVDVHPTSVARLIQEALGALLMQPVESTSDYSTPEWS